MDSETARKMFPGANVEIVKESDTDKVIEFEKSVGKAVRETAQAMATGAYMKREMFMELYGRAFRITMNMVSKDEIEAARKKARDEANYQ